jgi:imidazolonepropionase-like amidohydrolase
MITRTKISAAAVLAALAASAPASAETIAIVGATVWERPGKKLDNATVVVRDGVIASVGAGAAPAGATVIDGKGKIVTAGLIAAYTQIGLVEIELEPSSNDGRFDDGDGADAIHAAYRARDAYDPRAVAVPVARQGGVTSAVSGPSGGLIAGQSAWFTLGDSDVPAAPVRAAAAMNAKLGNGATRSGSRGMAIEKLREVLADAQVYGRNRAAYDRNQSRRLAAERLDLEALQPVLRGALPLVVHADAESDIRAALDIAREYRLKLTIVGGTEAWRVAPALAQAKVAVILDPSLNLPSDLGALDVRDDNAAALAAAGVDVAVVMLDEGGRGDPSQARTIRQLAGMAVARGLPWDKALAALTTVPAAIFGVTDRGTVTRGAAGDLVVWTGDPLELSTRAEAVIIGGVVQGTTSHQTRLLEKYRRLTK